MIPTGGASCCARRRPHIETQLGLVRERLGELNALHDQLVSKQQLVAEKIDALGRDLGEQARTTAVTRRA